MLEIRTNFLAPSIFVFSSAPPSPAGALSLENLSSQWSPGRWIEYFSISESQMKILNIKKSICWNWRKCTQLIPLFHLELIDTQHNRNSQWGSFQDLRADSIVREWNSGLCMRALRFGGRILHTITRQPRCLEWWKIWDYWFNIQLIYKVNMWNYTVSTKAEHGCNVLDR